MTDTIRINRVHYPVMVLGPGRRIGVWLQGCSIGCPSCLSKDTWPADAGNFLTISELVAECHLFESKGVDGITISGGEPFEQPEALESLLKQLHEWTDSLNSPVDYLCYSGKPFTELRQGYPGILPYLDTIIPEPFVVELSGKPLRGSENQPIIHFTELGASRFAKYAGESLPQSQKRIQLAVEDDAVWFIGLPERGDMENLVELCEAQGLYLRNASWE